MPRRPYSGSASAKRPSASRYVTRQRPVQRRRRHQPGSSPRSIDCWHSPDGMPASSPRRHSGCSRQPGGEVGPRSARAHRLHRDRCPRAHRHSRAVPVSSRLRLPRQPTGFTAKPILPRQTPFAMNTLLHPVSRTCRHSQGRGPLESGATVRHRSSLSCADGSTFAHNLADSKPVRFGGRRGDFPDRPHLRHHAQSLNPLARGYPNIAGCEFPPATVLRTAALQSKRTRSLAAYGAAKLIAEPLAQPQPPKGMGLVR